MKDIYVGATRWQVIKWKTARFLRKVMIMAFIAGSIWGAFKLGVISTTPEYVKADTIEVPIKASVMERIAQCESKKHQFLENGKLNINTNSKDGSHDVGYYQINDKIWAIKAMEMGYNLTTEEGNRGFAEKYLYPTLGTEPWVWTKSCWNK